MDATIPQTVMRTDLVVPYNPPTPASAVVIKVAVSPEPLAGVPFAPSSLMMWVLSAVRDGRLSEVSVVDLGQNSFVQRKMFVTFDLRRCTLNRHNVLYRVTMPRSVQDVREDVVLTAVDAPRTPSRAAR